MPRISTRRLSEVPAPTRTSRKAQVKQSEYNGYLRVLEDSEVGDLELDPADNSRSVKMSLQRAARRLGMEIDVWESNGHVYFRKSAGARKGRPRSMLDLTRYGRGQDESDS
jgi:hypothetical protein